LDAIKKLNSQPIFFYRIQQEKNKFRKFSKVRKIEIKRIRINLIEKQKEYEIVKLKSI
jgi:hypothetical protein